MTAGPLTRVVAMGSYLLDVRTVPAQHDLGELGPRDKVRRDRGYCSSLSPRKRMLISVSLVLCCLEWKQGQRPHLPRLAHATFFAPSDRPLPVGETHPASRTARTTQPPLSAAGGGVVTGHVAESSQGRARGLGRSETGLVWGGGAQGCARVGRPSDKVRCVALCPTRSLPLPVLSFSLPELKALLVRPLLTVYARY